MEKLKHHPPPLPVLFCVACPKCLVVQDGFLLWKTKQVYPANSIPTEESVLLQGHPKMRPQDITRALDRLWLSSFPPGLSIPLSLPRGTLELSVLLLIFAAPKLEFCLLLSSHPPVIPENPNTSPGFSQNPSPTLQLSPSHIPGTNALFEHNPPSPVDSSLQLKWEKSSELILC